MIIIHQDSCHDDVYWILAIHHLFSYHYNVYTGNEHYTIINLSFFLMFLLKTINLNYVYLYVGGFRWTGVMPEKR